MSNNSNYKSKIQFKQKNCDKPHIYKITNQIDGKYYYGVHNGSDTENYEGSGLLLHLAYEKHGKENFLKEILMWFDTEEEAYEYEEVVVNEKMINKNNPMCYNLCVGGSGGDKYSCQTPERQAEIRQKKSETWNNKTEAEMIEFNQKLSEANKGKNPLANKTEVEIAAISQKKSKTWNNKTEVEMIAFSQKLSDANKGKNKGKNPLANKTQDELEEFSQKMSDANKGEKNGTHTQYRHPYNFDFIGNGNKISHDIRKNYPNEKQWNQLTIKERQSYKIVSPE